ncbi:MAG TPA: TonB-dependent receptor family protein [Bacteroidia bacterium]|jgi:iron complex outermembrane receptor protein|nr:TonB-dependent receptor family protein [Bacteroidia bacterium]
MKGYILAILISFSAFTGNAQNKPAGAPASGKFKMPNIGRVYGKVLDATKAPVSYASVVLLKGDSVVNGNFTKDNGEFSLDNLPFGKFTVKFTFLGYKTVQMPVVINMQNLEQDMGNITLGTDDKMLKTVEVNAEKSASEMSIDRKIFNVDKDITSKGGTAMDVMKNIPSVTLDDQGNAQLRQNPATIYIDGRPTTLTLDQIPSDQIDRIEIITNPSAKYEASATGGIINIIMKTNAKPGYNGMVMGGVGTNDRYNGTVALNIRQKPFGISIMYNYNTADNPVHGYTNRTSLLNGSPTGFLNSSDNTNFKHTFQMGSIGLDYALNNRNTLTLSQTVVAGDFLTHDNQTFDYQDANHNSLGTGYRTAYTHTQFQNYTTKLLYKKTFPKKGQELTADIDYNTTIAQSPSNYSTSSFDAWGNPLPNEPNPALQVNNGQSNSQMYTFQADYVNPINDSNKIEMGVRANYRPALQYLDVTDYSYSSLTYVTDTFLTSHFKIKDLVTAAYVNYSTRWKRIDFMMGLRFEDSYYQGILTDKNASFSYQYPSDINNVMNSLFPSLFISKTLNSKQQLQFNVSRKLNRPNYRQMMPFIMFSDKNNYMIGNPNLTPEFITLAEANYSQTLNKGNFLFTLFYRNTTNPLTPYSYSSATDQTILITTTINGKQSNSGGIDFTLKYELFKNFEATWNVNAFYTIIDASYGTTSVSNQGYNYTTKLNFVYHFPKSFNLQLSGSYESPKIIPQGTTNAMYFADCGLSKDIKKFLVFTLSLSDIFDTKARGSHLATDTYSQDLLTRREVRYLKFTAMMRFGKADASIFKRKPQTQQQGDDGGFF